jgi:RNA polymerase sigma-70 factor (ECF subfamily)
MVSDEILMERLIAGQESSLESLVNRYEKPLFAFAKKMLREDTGAEDAFQETFIRVYRRRKSFSQGSRFRPWLYQICLNVCRDQLRRKKRRQEVELNEEAVGADDGPTPQEKAEQNQQARRVRKAILQLPPKQREILILSQYQNLSNEEISDVLSIPAGTVKSRKFTAIRSLAKLLSKLPD